MEIRKNRDMNVYLDNAATTRVCPEAAQAVIEAMSEQFGNPSSGHTPGREARNLLEKARGQVAAALGAREIHFTSGGTEANNWAIRGAVNLKRREGRHIITTSVEHDSVLAPMSALEKEGFEVSYLPPDRTGRVDISRLPLLLRPDTVLISMMAVNNETGVMLPVSETAAVLKRAKSNALFHVDFVQGFLKLPLSASDLGADLITISGHKLHAPKGVGALYIRQGLRFPPLLLGGGQESGYRSGTEALPAIAGFGAAVQTGMGKMEENRAHMQRLRDFAIRTLKANIPEILILGSGETGHILSISLPGYKSEVLMNYLDEKGVYLSKSSACKKGGRSHVLTAMGFPARVIDGALRVSFSKDNTMEELQYFCENLKRAKETLFPSLR